MTRGWKFWLKLLGSCAILALIYQKLSQREGSTELMTHLSELKVGWLLGCALMQFGAICTSVLRWDRLLVGQGIHAPLRHLVRAFMIGRFFGAPSPGGWSGLNGYRIYDIASRTGKTARAAAAIGIEMLLGQVAFGAVLVAGSIFGLRVIGWQGVVLVDGFFVAVIAMAILLISRPALFRRIAAWMPAKLRARLSTTIDAVCAYQGKGGLVLSAALLGMGTHAFNNLIYVCSARALGAPIGVGEVFFVSAMQIFATLLPLSLSGIGVREATAVALYGVIGVPVSVAFLIPAVGFAVEMVISSFGGVLLLTRRAGYEVDIRVDDPEREQWTTVLEPDVAEERWPKLVRGLVIGSAAGLVGGISIGLGEGATILATASGSKDYSVLLYGALAYGLPCAIGAGCAGFALAWSGRLMRREATAPEVAFGRFAGVLCACGVLSLGAFRIRRDLFDEMLVWASPRGALVLGGCLLAAAIVYLVVASSLRFLVARRALRWLSSAPGAALLLVVLVLGNLAFSGKRAGPARGSASSEPRPAAPAEAGNVLFIVVDTLRADHLPLWGYAAGKTPQLDAFARDAIRFEHAFANASWTRPSFASLMSGRYPSSHQTIHKNDSLPDGLVTVAEAMRAGGYTTYGVVTNYNVAPFFNFHQGFDEYHYLEPDFVLGANDTAAKLLLVQSLRQRIEAQRARRGQVAPGSAYQDATKVNAELFRFWESRPQAPWFVFAAYMDPHDPYFPHPYDGTGYSRAANATPDASEAPRLRALYDGEIAFWDERFGELIADLKRRGLYDDTTIVVTADHGEEFMDHGGYWHGTTLYDEQLHVPLLLKLPRAERGGTVVSHWVELIDISPSLLRENGIQPPNQMQGKDLMLGSESVFAEEDHEGNVLRALRSRRGAAELKVIEANPGNPRGLDPYELYRIDQDPKEQVNLAREEAELLTLSASQLHQQTEQVKKGRVERQTLNVAADENAVQKLRALGYAGGDKKE
jgi:arylsulfatase A-like enzyme/uncharacterized membrane protein YbhN (UPF0104 family)